MFTFDQNPLLYNKDPVRSGEYALILLICMQFKKEANSMF